MFKTAVYLVATFALVASVEYTLENCKCNDGYAASKNSEEKVECVGVVLDHILPCNLPAQPKCVCTQETATAIVSDGEGVWCVHSENGENKKKWACENTEDWTKYAEEMKEYEKSLKN